MTVHVDAMDVHLQGPIEVTRGKVLALFVWETHARCHVVLQKQEILAGGHGQLLMQFCFPWAARNGILLFYIMHDITIVAIFIVCKSIKSTWPC